MNPDTKEELGTFFVALGVGVVATLTRKAFSGYLRWVMNMLILDAAIVWYWSQHCHLPEDPIWLGSIHRTVCWKDVDIIGWSDTERIFWNVFSILAILYNVIPAYLRGGEGSRHVYHMKRRFFNPLISHIIAGILAVVFSGLSAIFARGETLKWVVPVAITLDLFHHVTIHRLLRNNDGLWILRATNMTAATTKFVVILNLASSRPVAMLDQMFLITTAFLGTRVYGMMVYLILASGCGNHFLGATWSLTQYWYSTGTALAAYTIMFRIWSGSRVIVWICTVNSAAMYFHQMWRNWLFLRVPLVVVSAILTVAATHTSEFTGAIITLGFLFSNFFLPHFKRYQKPKYEGAAKNESGDSDDESIFFCTPRKAPCVKMLRRNSRGVSAYGKGCFVGPGSGFFPTSTPDLFEDIEEAGSNASDYSDKED